MAELGAIEHGVADRTRTSSALGAYQPSLDGLRAVAMAVMLSYHAELQWAKGAYLGLSQFFTLSGFLITSILLSRQARTGSVALGRFWTNRYRRLLPAAYVTLAGVVVFGATVADPVQVKEIPGQIASAAAQVANWYFIVTDKSYVGLFASPSPVQHFWSLAVEEQFYLIMPLVFVGIVKVTKSLKAIALFFGGGALISTIWMIWLYHNGASIDRLYYGTDTRAAELLLGGLLAVILHRFPLNLSASWRKVMAALGIAAFAATAWGWTHLEITSGVMYQGGYLVFAAISCLLITSLLAGGPLRAILSWGFLPPMGRIIYGLYLYHWPIFLWLTADRTGLAPWPLFALRMVITFVLAIASYNLIEMPIRHGSFTWARAPIRYAIAPVVALSIVALAFVAGNREVPGELTPLATPISDVAPTATGRDGVLDVLVIPDDETEQVARRLQTKGEESDTLNVTVAEPFSCSGVNEVADGFTCANWLAEWPDLIERVDPDITVFFVDEWDVGQIEALSGLDATMDPQAVESWTTTVLRTGFALLTTNGAPVGTMRLPDTFADQVKKASDPFTVAVTSSAKLSPDVREIPNYGLGVAVDGLTQAYVDDAADVVLRGAELYRRKNDSEAPKVLVVGDSTARTLGFGLERWATETGSALVWTTATLGCGIADDASLRGVGDRPEQVDAPCLEVRDGWRRQIAEFDPDLVIVLSTIPDMQDRRLPGWDDFLAPGDAEFDAYLVREYHDAVDVLTAGGARVLWLKPPCVRSLEAAGGEVGASLGPSDTNRVRHLNDVILPTLAADEPSVRLFDLFGPLCPNGEFVEEIDGVEVRPDGVHYSSEGSRWFADRYGAALLEAGLR